ncbi:MAG: hypothetical protein LC802_19260 [Acidobacteria bacterium]|nr:hypothetical protein [Acidobacteriota bacterium]
MSLVLPAPHAWQTVAFAPAVARAMMASTSRSKVCLSPSVQMYSAV